MFGGLGDFFGGVGDWFAKIFEFLIGLPGLIADALKWLFMLIVDAVVGVAKAVWSFFSDPIGSIVGILSSILNFFGSLVKGILDGFLDMMKFLWIPDDSFFSGHFDALNDLLSQKIKTEDYQDLLNSLQYASRAGGLPPLTVTIWGNTMTIVDFSFYARYQNVIYGWVRGFTFVLLVLYNWNQIYKLIRGGSLFEASARWTSKGKEG